MSFTHTDWLFYYFKGFCDSDTSDKWSFLWYLVTVGTSCAPGATGTSAPITLAMSLKALNH